MRVDYVRGLASFEIGTPTAMMLVSGDQHYGLARMGTTTAMIAEQTEVQSGSVPFSFFDDAQQADAMLLAETDERAAADQASRTVRLSTGGLGRALGALHPHCGD